MDTASPASQARPARATFRWADVVAAPLHDFPRRDEILFQYLAFPASADVLEVGPGSGFTAFRLAPHVRSITLLDVAPRSIEELGQPLWCADALFHDRPLRRSSDRQARPQVYEATWAFRHRNRPRHGGDIFAAAPVGGRPLGR